MLCQVTLETDLRERRDDAEQLRLRVDKLTRRLTATAGELEQCQCDATATYNALQASSTATTLPQGPGGCVTYLHRK